LHMNPVLQFAIDNDRRARGLLVRVYGIPYDDVDDCAQQVLLAILQANPQDHRSPNVYWWATVRTVAYDCWRRLGRQRRTGPLDGAEGDWPIGGAQDPAIILERREEIAAALAQAKQAERAALVRMLTQPPRPQRETAYDRVRIHRFRRRLQGAMA